jgi:hypothetical protein
MVFFNMLYVADSMSSYRIMLLTQLTKVIPLTVMALITEILYGIHITVCTYITHFFNIFPHFGA